MIGVSLRGGRKEGGREGEEGGTREVRSVLAGNIDGLGLLDALLQSGLAGDFVALTQKQVWVAVQKAVSG